MQNLESLGDETNLKDKTGEIKKRWLKKLILSMGLAGTLMIGTGCDTTGHGYRGYNRGHSTYGYYRHYGGHHYIGGHHRIIRHHGGFVHHRRSFGGHRGHFGGHHGGRRHHH